MLSGKVAVVTGAGSGIGRATARALGAAGARVALLGRRLEPLEETRQLLGSGFQDAMTFTVDVADRGAVEKAIREVERTWQRIDIAVNNAGTNTPRRSLAEISPEDWDLVTAINLTGVFNVTRAALPALRRAEGGLVVNIGSTSGLRASSVAGIAYAASKHAIVGFTATVRLEERKHGIRATAIHPGEVDTPILEKRPAAVSEERRRVMLRPEDVAEAVLFVATRPVHVCLPVVVIEPVVQDF